MGSGVFRLKPSQDQWLRLEKHFKMLPDSQVNTIAARDGLQRCALGDALAVYHQLRSLETFIGPEIGFCAPARYLSYAADFFRDYGEYYKASRDQPEGKPSPRSEAEAQSSL